MTVSHSYGMPGPTRTSDTCPLKRTTHLIRVDALDLSVLGVVKVVPEALDESVVGKGVGGQHDANHNNTLVIGGLVHKMHLGIEKAGAESVLGGGVEVELTECVVVVAVEKLGGTCACASVHLPGHVTT